MPDRVLIWGAGAIGGSAGAWLKRAGHDVTFVDVVPEHVSAIRTQGLRITGPVEEFAVTAPAFLPEELSGTWQHAFLAVKAQHTEAATRSLTPHLTQDGYVLSLQNGLNETIIQRVVGRDRTIGAFINYGADWIAPGEIMFGNRGAVVLGELDGAMTPRLAALHTVMRDFEPDAITTADIWSYLWGKLGYGAMLFAQALGQKGIADCLARSELLPLWRRLGKKRSWSRRPKASNPAASTATTSRPSGRAPAKKLPGRALPRWWRSTAPARRRTPACGAILPFASAAPRWTSRSRPSRISVHATVSIAAPPASWST